MCLSLQMAKVFWKVLRADALGGAEQWDAEHWSQGEGLNVENSGGGAGSPVEFISVTAHLHLVNYSVDKAHN